MGVDVLKLLMNTFCEIRAGVPVLGGERYPGERRRSRRAGNAHNLAYHPRELSSRRELNVKRALFTAAHWTNGSLWYRTVQ